LFRKPADYYAFAGVLASAVQTFPIRLFAYCVMPNHWHLVLLPCEDKALPRFAHWLTTTHATRWRSHYQTTGHGHVYKERFKAFPIQQDGHFLTVCRYVERNAARANLVTRAELWPWSSAWRLVEGNEQIGPALSSWPVPRPEGWLNIVNTPLSAAEIEHVRQSAQRGTPFGSSEWQLETASSLNLLPTLRRRGRPSLKGSFRK
jgi:putative transposase